MASIKTARIFQIFFNNFLEIINSAKLSLEQDLNNSSMIINEENKAQKDKKIKKKVNQIFYESFNIFRKYPNELNELILRCHNFLSIILFSIDQYSVIDEEETSFIDPDVYSLFQTFVMSFGVIHDINEYFSILDYKTFYNGGISKHLNLRRDFSIYIKNEKIRRKKIKTYRK